MGFRYKYNGLPLLDRHHDTCSAIFDIAFRLYRSELFHSFLQPSTYHNGADIQERVHLGACKLSIGCSTGSSEYGRYLRRWRELYGLAIWWML
jgi:hypothetical protein